MLTHSQKRYLFAIYSLGKEGNYVRLTDVAKFLGVSKSSAVKMTERLVDDGFILKEPYREILLTKSGIKSANELYTPFIILEQFLINQAGISTETAKADAMLISAQADDETIEKLIQYALEHNYNNT